MKKIVLALSIIVMTVMFSINAYALGRELPKYELPKVEDVEKPQLSKDYGKMKENMDKEWQSTVKSKPDINFEEKQNYINGMKDKSAYDLFKEKYGDNWEKTKKQYSKDIDKPSDKYFSSYLDTLATAAQTKLDTNRKLDTEQMKTVLSKSLDTSRVWNLSDLKSKTNFMNSKQIDEYLNGALKPAGWDDIKAQSYKVKGKDFLDEIPIVSSIVDGLNEIKGIFDQFMGSGSPQPGEGQETTIEDILKGIDNKQSVTDSQLKDLKDAASKESGSFFNIFK